MEELFHRIEAERQVIIPDVIRYFLVETAIESLYLRQDAWRQGHNAEPGIDAHAGRVGEQIQKSLLQLLSNAETELRTPDGVRQVTFIGVLQYIHNHWCQIFPFCGKKNPPLLPRVA